MGFLESHLFILHLGSLCKLLKTPGTPSGGVPATPFPGTPHWLHNPCRFGGSPRLQSGEPKSVAAQFRADWSRYPLPRDTTNCCTSGPLYFFPPLWSVGDPPKGKCYVATPRTCGPLLIWCPALGCWGPPRRQGLSSQSSHLWAIADFVPRFGALWTPKTGRVVCSQSTHLWATSDFVPCFGLLGTPRRQGLCSQSTHLWAVAIFVPPLGRWGPPKRQRKCGQWAHL